MEDAPAHAHQDVQVLVLEQPQVRDVHRVVPVVRLVAPPPVRVPVLAGAARDAHHLAEAIVHQIVPALV